MPVIPKKIYIRHFGTIKETELTFPRSGLCLMIGQNLTSAGVESVAAGKTLLGEAISRVLLDVPGRFTDFGSYSSDHFGNKDTMVKLECDLDGKPLTIWSGFKTPELSKTGEGLKFQLGSQDPVQHGNIADTRRELASLLRVQSELAEHTIHLDGMLLKFNKLSERKLVDMFLAATSVASWGQAQAKVNQSISSTEQEKSGLASRVSLLKDNILAYGQRIADNNERLAEEKERIEERRTQQESAIEKVQQKIQNATKQKKQEQKRKIEIKAEIKKLEDQKAEVYAKLELKLKRTVSDIALLSAKVEEASGNFSSSQTAYNTALNSLNSLKEPDNCPTCGKVWDKQHSKNLLAEESKKVAEAKAVFEIKSAQLEDQKRERQKARDRQAEIQQEMKQARTDSDVKELSDEYEECENSEDDLQDNLKILNDELAELSKPVNDAVLVSLRAQIETDAKDKLKAENDLVETNQKLVEVGAFLQVLEYLYKAFGPTGLPNMQLKDCLSYMNRTSSHLSNLLTGNLVEITFSTTKTLARGEEKPALTINTSNRMGAKKFGGSSKGEGGVSNLIIAETLYSVGRLWQKVGYRWLDEAVNSQDKTVRGSVYSYFREQAKLNSLLTFVVDHSPDVESYADHVIIADKSKAGVTSYRFA